jgi:hypothetical protein
MRGCRQVLGVVEQISLAVDCPRCRTLLVGSDEQAGVKCLTFGILTLIVACLRLLRYVGHLVVLRTFHAVVVTRVFKMDLLQLWKVERVCGGLVEWSASRADWRGSLNGIR